MTPPTTPLRDGQPCGHPGCLSHRTHPCEGCGRIAGTPPTAPSADASVSSPPRWTVEVGYGQRWVRDHAQGRMIALCTKEQDAKAIIGALSRAEQAEGQLYELRRRCASVAFQAIRDSSAATKSYVAESVSNSILREPLTTNLGGL